MGSEITARAAVCQVLCKAKTMKSFVRGWSKRRASSILKAMAEVFKAMSVSGGILLLVVILMIVVSMAAVRRGVTSMQDNPKKGRH